MSCTKLEELVDKYIAGEVLSEGNIQVTYGMYNELKNILSSEGLNLQESVIVLLPLIDHNVVPPKWIGNLSCMVQKHLISNKPKDMVISTLHPAISDDNETSPYCASAGVTVSKITSDEPLHVVDKFLTNKLV